jgi:dienelactone hydrolase
VDRRFDRALHGSPRAPTRTLARARRLAPAVAVACLAAACTTPSTAASTTPTTQRVAPTTSTTVAPTTSTSTTTVAPPTTTTTSTLPPLVVQTAPLRVGSRTYDWFDASRPTPANGNYRARRGRELVTTIWYPAIGPADNVSHRGATPDHARGPFPVVLLAHGHAGEPSDYAAVATNWASRGYIVVAPAFPLSQRRALGGPSFADLLQQPGDLSYALTRVLLLNLEPGSWLNGLIDARRVGAVGHSMGAWTVLALAANACCRDPRVKAAIVLAGEMAPGFSTKFFTTPTPPLLFVHARDDATVPYNAGARAYKAARAPKYFLTLPIGGHLAPYFGAGNPEGASVLQVTNEFLDHYLRGISTDQITSPDPRFSTLHSRL